MTVYLTRRGRAATVMCCRCAALTCMPGLDDDPELHARMVCWACGAQEMTVRFAATLTAVRVGERDYEGPEPAPRRPAPPKKGPAGPPPQLSLFGGAPP